LKCERLQAAAPRLPGEKRGLRRELSGDQGTARTIDESVSARKRRAGTDAGGITWRLGINGGYGASSPETERWRGLFQIALILCAGEDWTHRQARAFFIWQGSHAAGLLLTSRILSATQRCAEPWVVSAGNVFLRPRLATAPRAAEGGSGSRM
jgi:hypothetical protein